MSSPWVPKTKRDEAAAPPSPTSSPETVVAEPRKYSRYPNAAFGERLANARNLHHTQAPPPPPPHSRSLGSSAGGGVKLAPSTTPAVLSAASTGSPATQPVGENPRPETKRFGDMSSVNTTEASKKEPVVTMPKSKVENPPSAVRFLIHITLYQFMY